MMAGDFTEIPILDLSLADDPATLPMLLDRLKTALTDVGFLYVSNHGVSASSVAELVRVLGPLFALPRDAKAAVALDNSPHFLGYSGTGAETTAGRADQREQVEFATELDSVASEKIPWDRLRGPNQWPCQLPELRPIVERYIEELTQLGERFLRLVAKALSLPEETFFSYLSDQHRLKLVHYPASPSGNQGVGPHKDSSGWWTFLLQASPEVRGLQVLNKAGAWVDVPEVPGTFVVNIGQAFEVVTHGVCKATTHRVISSETERFSVPFFQGVRRSLTKPEAFALANHFSNFSTGIEPDEGVSIDSPFLTGMYETWGEAQLRTKIRSHRKNGRRFYPDLYERYENDSN
ncbi:hypothetical protein B0J13DRAFT_561735 [Dactylonectria estremocensis]|uniref:Fe2OG dioxygenase domain-containing protein n=1 Tax=Dactylonectria estremocensis TaxID=1079267 RepID=A0A9P9EAX1_9HYPO|nr:hypothetical protein B0J13DRAFT_561735 [Dactylonectria estremocensis]